MSRKPASIPQDPVEVDIESLTHEGRGLAHLGGKAVFVDGALAGERVRFRYTRRQRRFDEGVVVEVLRPSPDRTAPRCTHFGICGGCSLQHLESAAQIEAKQASLGDVLARIGKVRPDRWLPPLSVDPWGYRRKARLGVRYVAKKNRTLVGFRERGHRFITDVRRCEVLHPAVGERIEAIAAAVDRLGIREQIPQIEVAIGEEVPILVFRVLSPPSSDDLAVLSGLGEREGFRIYLQEAGPESIVPLPGHASALYYDLPRHALRLEFDPTGFTQVNAELNRLMVDQALSLLDVRETDRVLDLFCGLGNFTLPLARCAEAVVGIEGEAALVSRARSNAALNGIHNARFHQADLYGGLDAEDWAREGFDKALLDPPRSGALPVLDWLPRLGVERVLYVSCYPATLARDADRLVNSLGYRLVAAGVMDMFPQTAHVESMALFERLRGG